VTTPTIDVHLHLAGTGCCDSGCWIAPTFKKRLTFRALKLMHGITEHAMKTTADADWAARMARTLAASGVDYGVALGFDGVYHKDLGTFDPDHSQLVVPPEWVFKVCKEHRNLLPGPSINPYRKDALERLAYAIENGAVLIKWLPPAQGIDPADARLDPFFRMLADARMPLLVHVGRERTFKTVTNEFNEATRLVRALDLGVTVIAAHSATRVLGTDEEDQTESLKALLAAHPGLWVDNSGLANPSRFLHLPKLAKDPLITARTLYGSDWPVPSNALWYTGQLPLGQIVKLERTANVIARDVAIKRAFGYPEATLTRAASVLANLDRWDRRAGIKT
jgi:predicted TIM-barrel fold metal-dependent hydrolase